MNSEYRYYNRRWCKVVDEIDNRFIWLLYDMVTEGFYFRWGDDTDNLEEFKISDNDVPEVVDNKFREYMVSPFYEIDKRRGINGFDR